MNINTQQFIDEHENDDIFKLSLQVRKIENIDADLVIRQINGRQKIRYKVPMIYECKDILYPVQLSLEQSSSQSTAQYKTSLCSGNTFVDLTGGFGVDSCFISQNFKKAFYIERDLTLCELARHNFNALGIKNIEAVNKDAVQFLNETPAVDCIYLDPARRSLSGKKVFKFSDCEPDITAIYDLLLAKAEKVMVKLSPMIDLTQVINELEFIDEIHVISLDNECKEVLLIINKIVSNKVLVHTINIIKHHQQTFRFYLDDEAQSVSNYSSNILKYLYEPNASILKAGAFKLTGTQFNLFKLHSNTHLYTSDQLINDFPGRTFEVQEVYGNSKTELKRLKTNITKANVSNRNYPITVEAFRKKRELMMAVMFIFLLVC